MILRGSQGLFPANFVAVAEDGAGDFPVDFATVGVDLAGLGLDARAGWTQRAPLAQGSFGRYAVFGENDAQDKLIDRFSDGFRQVRLEFIVVVVQILVRSDFLPLAQAQFATHMNVIVLPPAALDDAAHQRAVRAGQLRLTLFSLPAP